MLDMVMEYLPAVIGVVATGLTLALAWGIRKINIKEELKEAIVAFTKRTVDKAAVDLKMATDPASAGGAKITSEEMSDIRQKAFDRLKGELKGPLAKMALGWGEERIKGLIGGVLEKKGITVKAAK